MLEFETNQQAKARNEREPSEIVQRARPDAIGKVFPAAGVSGAKLARLAT